MGRRRLVQTVVMDKQQSLRAQAPLVAGTGDNGRTAHQRGGAQEQVLQASKCISRLALFGDTDKPIGGSSKHSDADAFKLVQLEAVAATDAHSARWLRSGDPDSRSRQP